MAEVIYDEKLEEQKAATKIQAIYHGKKDRRSIQKKKDERAEEVKAATKIQANFRGHAARKAVAAKKAKVASVHDPEKVKMAVHVDKSEEAHPFRQEFLESGVSTHFHYTSKEGH